ncbi:MAG: maleylpyruvate isomerase family mycothiol-dependent enzyme [Actinobacteria bacterium]|nr:maleylpyruvate isomerase family mycothiol-dependent enzyme [Actinomycetota bacterium]
MDVITEWTDAQGRVIELVESLGDEETQRAVPATPDWTVTQLLAHMVGLSADVLAGDEPDDHNPSWTQRQVDSRAGRTPAELVAEWRTLTKGMQDYLRDNGPRPLNDIVIHEQDLRGAVGRPGGRDTSALAAVRDVMAERFATRVRQAHLPPVELRSPAWIFSTGDGDPGLELFAPDFDLIRALMTRRTAGQLRQWSLNGQIDQYLPVFAGLGPLPESPLPE